MATQLRGKICCLEKQQEKGMKILFWIILVSIIDVSDDAKQRSEHSKETSFIFFNWRRSALFSKTTS